MKAASHCTPEACPETSLRVGPAGVNRQFLAVGCVNPEERSPKCLGLNEFLHAGVNKELLSDQYYGYFLTATTTKKQRVTELNQTQPPGIAAPKFDLIRELTLTL